MSDPENRKLVTDLVPKKLGKLHPVGRLDFQSEGLILLTNDGEFTNTVNSSKKFGKVYEVKTKGIPPEPALNKLRRGFQLEDGFKTAPCEITQIELTKTNAWFEVVLYEGHNQQIRKMFNEIGHSVVKLKRIAIGNLTIDKMPVGAFCLLDQYQVKKFLQNPTATRVLRKPKKPKFIPKPKQNDKPSGLKTFPKAKIKNKITAKKKKR